MDNDKFSKLSFLFFHPRSPVSFTSVQTVYKHVLKNKQLYPRITLPILQEFERNHVRANQVVRNRVDKFPRLKTFANGLNHVWQMDLVDLHASKNAVHSRFLLVKIDVFSRQLDAVVLPNKSAKSTLVGFQKILRNRGAKPHHVHTDEGKEFFNKQFTKFCKLHNINHYHTNSEEKAALVERANRTIQGPLYRILEHNRVHKKRVPIALIVDRVVNNYNNRHHSTLGCAPEEITVDVSGILAERQVFKRKEWASQYPPKSFVFSIGDTVRISLAREPFSKAYKGTFSREIFVIHKRTRQIGNVPLNLYNIVALDGQPVKGVFYEKQLQKVGMGDIVVDRVIARDNKRGLRLVTLVDHPPTHSVWINRQFKIVSSSTTPNTIV